MSKDLKFFGAHRADGKPDDCVIAHIDDDGKITYEVQGNFAALFIAGINHANTNEKFREDLTKLAVATEMADDNISPEEAFKKIQEIKPITASNQDEVQGKTVKKRETLAGIHDEMDSKLVLVTYEDSSVDIELQGNKAGILVATIYSARKDPEGFEDTYQMLQKIADVNLEVFKHGGMKDCVVVSGTFHDILNDMCSKEDPVIKAIGLRKLIEQIEDQDDILEFLTRVKNEPDFPHKDDILQYATDKFRAKFSSGASC